MLKKLRLRFDSLLTITVAAAAFLLPMNFGNEASGQENQQSIEVNDWVTRLKAAPEGSRWFVGANFGIELSTLPNYQALNILQQCWNEIADDVRPQILKGLCPALKKTDGINDCFFNILHLGYNDSNERVRQFAKAYVNQLTFNVNADDDATYLDWYSTIKDKKATEIVVGETKKFVSSLERLTGDEIQSALDQLHEAANNMREFKAMRKAAIDGGMMEMIETWIAEGNVEPDDRRILHIRRNIEHGEKFR